MFQNNTFWIFIKTISATIILTILNPHNIQQTQCYVADHGICYSYRFTNKDFGQRHCYITNHEIDDNEVYPTNTVYNGFVNFKYQASGAGIVQRIIVTDWCYEKENITTLLNSQYPIGQYIDCYYYQRNPNHITLGKFDSE